MTKVKICGLKRQEDIAYVNELEPDYIGFVFASSKRQVTPLEAASLKNKLCNKIKAVGVFVREDINKVAEIANQNIIDLIQLHGDEDKEYLCKLKELTKKPIIKVIRVKDTSSFVNLEQYPCDFFLFDTFTKDQFGGAGKSFDYTLLKKANIKKPFFLAGGISSENVDEILKEVKPYGVDVSSSVETGGVKDFEKIKEFIEKVK